MPRAQKIQLQERDIALLRGLFECRVMTTQHASSLYFQRRRESAKKRLQKLKSAGLLCERPRRQFEPAILFLARRGLIVLRDHGILDSYPEFDIPTLTRRARVSDMTLRHELAVLDLKVAFHAAAHDNISIVEFSTWPLLNQFEVPQGVHKPDAFVRLMERLSDGAVRHHSFYIELDRSTEPLATLVARARGYMAHRKRVPVGKTQSGFRVLYVLRSDERRENIARRLLTSTPPTLSLVSLATFADAKRDPLNAIWTCPLDYNGSSPTSARLLNPPRRHTPDSSAARFGPAPTAK